MQNSIVDPSECLIHPLRRSSALNFAVVAGFCLSIASALCQAQAAEPVKIPMTADRWTTTAGTVNFIEFKGKPSIELKQGNYAQHIQSGAVLLNGLTFRNGTIEYDGRIKVHKSLLNVILHYQFTERNTETHVGSALSRINSKASGHAR